MSLLVFAAVVLIVLILAFLLIDTIPAGDPRLKWVLKLIALIAIVQRAGWA